jgi:DNA-directed RNA polymerase subunit RPC12/RpoP
MNHNKTCISCGEEFNLNSPEKKRAGGLATTCPDCSEETVVKYAGVQSADGKQAQATILKFESEQDKSRYIAFWRNNTGFNKGKSCQLGTHLSTTPGIMFTSVATFSPTNHKGKST